MSPLKKMPSARKRRFCSLIRPLPLGEILRLAFTTRCQGRLVSQSGPNETRVARQSGALGNIAIADNSPGGYLCDDLPNAFGFTDGLIYIGWDRKLTVPDTIR